MELIVEDVQNTEIIDAIKKRYEVKINYASDGEGKGEGERVIQPVAYGLSSAGNEVLRAFQPYGDTKTKVPHWKLFRVDKINQWKPIKNRKFDEPPARQFGQQGKFNPNGDKTMSTVYIVADFEGAKQRYEKGGLSKYNQQRRIAQIAKNPYYELQKNIEKGIMASPEVMKNIELWHKQKQERLKRQQQTKTGNQPSIDNMASITQIGDDKNTSTSGPIYKGNTETGTVQNQNNLDYTQTLNNGPQYKNK